MAEGNLFTLKLRAPPDRISANTFFSSKSDLWLDRDSLCFDLRKLDGCVFEVPEGLREEFFGRVEG